MDKMILMVYGHEIYFTSPSVDKQQINIILAYGHNMNYDGIPKYDNLEVKSYTDNNMLLPILQKQDEYYNVQLKYEKSDNYTFFADLSPVVYTNTKSKGFKEGPKSMYKDVIYSGLWHQMAKIIIPTSSKNIYVPQHFHGILDIIPNKAILTKGEDVDLTLFYEGKPLAGIDIKVFSKTANEEIGNFRTGETGTIKVGIKYDGEWMFLVRYKDSSKNDKKSYDETIFVSTLVMYTK